MQTHFSLAQLADPTIAEAEGILRNCVHCGFCTATCPTYVLLGDELDSPRGRIYLIKDMLENDRPANANVVKHIDRCLSCLACTTTCPSGVDYMHLVDGARARIEKTYTRPLADRWFRALLAALLPYPKRFRVALLGAAMVRPFAGLFGMAMGGRIAAMFRLAPRYLSPPDDSDRPGSRPAAGARVKRVALLTGCAQPVLRPEINAATIRLLTRHGVEVVVAEGAGCCGALSHHMGKEAAAADMARANVDAWWQLKLTGGLDAVVINASGCGTTVKDYAHMLASDPDYADKAAELAAMTVDVTELCADLDLTVAKPPEAGRVTYHSACSMQHGQKITQLPKQLLTQAGFAVAEVPEGHLCCGSAGTYNLLQPQLAERLKARKLGHIASTHPDVIATGNIGCMMQLGSGTDVPVVHTVELLDWASGGPKPAALEPDSMRAS
jgi:glycolate oxidase iron-sulfur subunit